MSFESVFHLQDGRGQYHEVHVQYNAPLVGESLYDLLSEMHAIMASEMDRPPLPTLSKSDFDGMFKRDRFTKRTLRPTDSRECAICMQEYKTNRRVSRLPCGHIFCSDCLCRWLTRQSATCPVCRHPI